jgi:hypothetical protein
MLSEGKERLGRLAMLLLLLLLLVLLLALALRLEEEVPKRGVVERLEELAEVREATVATVLEGGL